MNRDASTRGHEGAAAQPEIIPLSLLNDYLYCPRRAALKVVEGWRSENEHTVRGDIVHEHADLPGYEVAKGVKVLRALPVFSDRLGLSGKCDVVEAVLSAGCGVRNAECDAGLQGQRRREASAYPELQGTETASSPQPSPPPISALLRRGKEAEREKAGHVGGYRVLVPVEYKKGKRRRFENDDAQLCAQALCLEEMFGIPVERGAVFHAESKRRREVAFTPELRALTMKAIAELHELVAAERVPAAIFKPACEECSLFEICLPKATAEGNRAGRLSRELFKAG
jgi:CRISPR-associated exonuclease Cas4